MEKILNELETAFNIISVIPVSGNAVDAMADARAKLRYVYAELKQKGVSNNDCGQNSQDHKEGSWND